MSKHRPRKIDRETAERLLHGRFAVPEDGSDALAGLLAAAAAPAQPGELAGEPAAVAAFWDASRSAAPQPRDQPGFGFSMAKFLTVKAAAVAVALTAFGGAALVAGAGELSVTLSDSGQATHRQPTPTASRPKVAPAPKVSPHPVGPPRSTSSVSPTPALAKLCRKYLTRLKKAGLHDSTGKPHQLATEPGYAALLKEAGGQQKIVGRCQEILRALEHDGRLNNMPTLPPGFPTKLPTWPPGHPPWPTEQSTDQPTDHVGQ
jgi:hypothetical protein